MSMACPNLYGMNLLGLPVRGGVGGKETCRMFVLRCRVDRWINSFNKCVFHARHYAELWAFGHKQDRQGLAH